MGKGRSDKEDSKRGAKKMDSDSGDVKQSPAKKKYSRRKKPFFSMQLKNLLIKGFSKSPKRVFVAESYDDNDIEPTLHHQEMEDIPPTNKESDPSSSSDDELPVLIPRFPPVPDPLSESDDELPVLIPRFPPVPDPLSESDDELPVLIPRLPPKSDDKQLCPVGSFSCGSVAGRLKLKDSGGNVIDCLSGKKIPLDVDSIEVINGDAKFILLVENASIDDNWLNKVNDDDVCCIMVTTTICPPDDATKEFLCKLQRKLQLKVCVLLDCIPRSVKIISDLICQDGVDIIWLGIHSSDVPILIEDGIQVERIDYDNVLLDNIIHGDYYTIEQTHLFHQLHLMMLMMINGWHVPIKTLPYNYLIDRYPPYKLKTYGVPGF